MLKRFFKSHQSESPELSEEKQVRTVLMLEDDPELSSIIRECLEAHGFCVATAKNGVDGLKKIMEQDYDVILCDMLMPSLPGDMFYIAIQKVRPHLCQRFIFMTGHQGNKKIDDFIRNVRGLMLWKPFEMHQLLDSINCVLKKSASEV